MAYTLLYSRNITSDDRVRFTDVPITETSIMVDILSLRSPFYRIAGYAYSIVSDGLIDYERGAGYTLPFGKNRLFFPNSVLPYFLEFFPKWGTKQAIISVYTGTPPLPDPTGAWKPIPAYDTEFRLAQNPYRIEYRKPIGSATIQSMAQGAVAGAEAFGYLVWKRFDESYWYALTDNLLQELPASQAGYDDLRAKPEAVIF